MNHYMLPWNRACGEAGSFSGEENSSGENRTDDLLLFLRSFCHRAIESLPDCALHEVSESLQEFATYYSNSADCTSFTGTRATKWTPLHAELAPISEAVERGWKILERVDEEGAALVTRETLTRAVNFLQNSARSIWETYHIQIDAPIFRPGPDGSIDLHWAGPNSETLINVPANFSEPITYFGDDKKGNSAEGNLVSGENIGLILWLTKKH